MPCDGKQHLTKQPPERKPPGKALIKLCILAKRESYRIRIPPLNTPALAFLPSVGRTLARMKTPLSPLAMALGALALGACGAPTECRSALGTRVFDSQTDLCAPERLAQIDTVEARSLEAFGSLGSVRSRGGFSLSGWTLAVSETPGRTFHVSIPERGISGDVVAYTFCDRKVIQLAAQWGIARVLAHEIAHVADRCVERDDSPDDEIDEGHAGFGAEGFTSAIHSVNEGIPFLE